MKKTLWLILILMVFGCARVEKEVRKEVITLPITSAAEKEPRVVRRETIPLPQLIPLPLAKSKSPELAKSISKGLPQAEKVRIAKTEIKLASGTHSVKKGECLWRIAEKHYHDGFLYEFIAQTNQIQSPYIIYPGQILIIPRLHLVKRGEYLSKIAEKYYRKGTLYGTIAQANHIPSPYIIHPGQVLIIPAKDAISSRIEAKTRIEAEELPKLGQPIGEKPYQITWQEAIDKFDLPILVKEQVKKNVKEDKFQWFETGLTGEQKLSQLIFGDGEIWNDALCYWSFRQGYQVRNYGTDQYRVIRLSECGSWTWWKEEPRGPPKELAALKVVPKDLTVPKEVPTKKKEASFSWLATSLWIVAISLIAMVAIGFWKTARKKPERKGG